MHTESIDEWSVDRWTSNETAAHRVIIHFSIILNIWFMEGYLLEEEAGHFFQFGNDYLWLLKNGSVISRLNVLLSCHPKKLRIDLESQVNMMTDIRTIFSFWKMRIAAIPCVFSCRNPYLIKKRINRESIVFLTGAISIHCSLRVEWMLIATGTPVGVFTSTAVVMIMTPGGLFCRGIVRKKNLINFIPGRSLPLRSAERMYGKNRFYRVHSWSNSTLSS